jgi:hypothetical protein
MDRIPGLHEDDTRIPFLRWYDGFVLDPDALGADRIKVLYERTDPPQP